MPISGPPATASDLARVAQSADDALVVEVVDDEGHVELVFGSARVPGVLRDGPAFLVEGTEQEVVVFVGDERVGVCVRVVVGCRVAAGQVARVGFVALDVSGRRLRPTSSTPAALAGRLDQVPLVDVVQLACAARREAVLEIRGAAGCDGAILLRGGRAVYARCTDGTGGEEAFFALLRLEAGTFELRHEPVHALENLGADTHWLLLEAMRRLDEAAGGAVPVVDDSTEPTTPGLTGRREDPITMPRLRARSSVSSSIVSSRDEEHLVEPVLTPVDLRRHSVPPTREVVDGGSGSGPAGTTARTSGRFARFFDEVSQTTGVRPATTSLPPSEDIDLVHTDGIAVELFDSEESPALDDDVTAKLRLPSLRVAATKVPSDRNSTVVRRSSRPTST